MEEYGFVEAGRFRTAESWGPVPDAPPGHSWSSLMAEALREAAAAAAEGEVPVGAVLVDSQGQILARAHNLVEKLHDPSAHAEILVLRAAAALRGNHRLTDCVLVVSLEPCLMCTGAIREARLAGVVYGAADARAGAVVSCLDGLDVELSRVRPWHYGGVESAASLALLQDFFRALRPARD